MAADYQLFAAWLQLPAPRCFPKAAAVLGCSLHRLRRLSRRYHWKRRAVAFDNHQAEAASAAFNQLLRAEQADWLERARRFRHQEWQLHEQVMDAALAAVRHLQCHPGCARLAEITRLLDLASALGRRACGLPVDPASPEPSSPLVHSNVAETLRKVYGADAGALAEPAPLQESAGAKKADFSAPPV